MPRKGTTDAMFAEVGINGKLKSVGDNRRICTLSLLVSRKRMVESQMKKSGNVCERKEYHISICVGPRNVYNSNNTDKKQRYTNRMNSRGKIFTSGFCLEPITGLIFMDVISRVEKRSIFLVHGVCR